MIVLYYPYSYSRCDVEYINIQYRSGWGTKSNQERTLAIWLKRSSFERILSEAFHSHYIQEIHGSKGEWQKGINKSTIRLQWDPGNS